MRTHSSILAWKIPWTEEPGGLQSLGSPRVGHDWAHVTSTLIEHLHCARHSLWILSFNLCNLPLRYRYGCSHYIDEETEALRNMVSWLSLLRVIVLHSTNIYWMPPMYQPFILQRRKIHSQGSQCQFTVKIFKECVESDLLSTWQLFIREWGPSWWNTLLWGMKVTPVI